MCLLQCYSCVIFCWLFARRMQCVSDGRHWFHSISILIFYSNVSCTHYFLMSQASNGDPRQPNSLHYFHPYQVLNCCNKLLLFFCWFIYLWCCKTNIVKYTNFNNMTILNLRNESWFVYWYKDITKCTTFDSRFLSYNPILTNWLIFRLVTCYIQT